MLYICIHVETCRNIDRETPIEELYIHRCNGKDRPCTRAREKVGLRDAGRVRQREEQTALWLDRN